MSDSTTQRVRVLQPIKFDDGGVVKRGQVVEVPATSVSWLVEYGLVEPVAKLASVPNGNDVEIGGDQQGSGKKAGGKKAGK